MNLSDPGKPLKAEPPDAREFAGLKRSGKARLQDALNVSLSLEGRFDLAYNAAQIMPFARPPFQDLLGAIDFAVAKNYPARGEFTGPVRSERGAGRRLRDHPPYSQNCDASPI